MSTIYNGVAMVFSAQEMNDILMRYAKQNPESKLAEAVRESEDDFMIEFCEADINDNCFSFDDHVCRLFSRDEKLKFYEEEICEIDFTSFDRSINRAFYCDEDLMYTLFPSNPISVLDMFEDERPYPTYEDLKNEYVKKLKGLVPDDFNYDSRIGYFECLLSY